jgi:tRNA-2-methylthio-N6-dimethylallyladenosine synthase
MRRRYAADDVRRLADALHRARAGLVLTTDLIVGHPGETETDFRETCALVCEAGFVDAFAFKYSPRPGTAAAERTDRVDPLEAQARLECLQDLVRSRTLAYHRSRVGGRTEILVEGPSRQRGGQIQGRDPQHRVVNLTPRPGSLPAPGALLGVEIVEALPHCLLGERLEGAAAGTAARLRVKEPGRIADEAGREPALA